MTHYDILKNVSVHTDTPHYLGSIAEVYALATFDTSVFVYGNFFSAGTPEVSASSGTTLRNLQPTTLQVWQCGQMEQVGEHSI
jgi:hypothetical protein